MCFKMLNFSAVIVPLIISAIVFCGLAENKNVYDLFCEGAKEGIEIAIKMFPTLIGIFLAIGMLRNSGTLDFIANLFTPIVSKFNVPTEIIPLALIKPISGSASMALATNLMTNFGTETRIGIISATIMGASETTFYVIAVYMNSIKAKIGRKVIIPAILADFASIITAICIIR